MKKRGRGGLFLVGLVLVPKRGVRWTPPWKFFAYARMREEKSKREREIRSKSNFIADNKRDRLFVSRVSSLNLSRTKRGGGGGNGLQQFHPSRVIENKTGPLRMGPNKYRMYGPLARKPPIKILRIVSLLRRKWFLALGKKERREGARYRHTFPSLTRVRFFFRSIAVRKTVKTARFNEIIGLKIFLFLFRNFRKILAIRINLSRFSKID